MIELFGFAMMVWLLCGAAAAAIGMANGRSGCGFLLLGVLLGPIAIAVALIVGRDRAAATAAQLNAGDLRRCDSCAEVIQLAATVCPHCRRQFDPAMVRFAIDRRQKQRSQQAMVTAGIVVVLLAFVVLATR